MGKRIGEPDFDAVRYSRQFVILVATIASIMASVIAGGVGSVIAYQQAPREIPWYFRHDMVGDVRELRTRVMQLENKLDRLVDQMQDHRLEHAGDRTDLEPSSPVATMPPRPDRL